MGYAITVGAGLVLGVALLIWALGERSKRAQAERAAATAINDARASGEVARFNEAAAKTAEEFSARLSDEVSTLRGRLNETRVRLAQSNDPKAIKEWLDSELEADTL